MARGLTAISPAIWVAVWATLAAVALVTRPLLPIDETRYLGVAWEMWTSGNYLVPHLNGEPYPDKPPLLFWMINLVWALFGVGDAVARLVAPTFALGTLALTAALARRLWPDRPGIAALAPLMLVGSLFWATVATFTLFDMLVSFFTLVALIGFVETLGPHVRRGWVLGAAAIALGILAKGPVILAHVLPVALAAPLWAGDRRPRSWPAWYRGLAGTVAAGATVALAWVVPAAWSGGIRYADAILWEQTAGRMTESFAHQGPWWLYLALLPAVLLPWFPWPPVWRGLAGRSSVAASPGGRFCVAWLALSVLVLSLISAKQLHYLVPSLPAAALLAAASVDSRPDLDGRMARLAPAGLFALAAAVLAALAVVPLVPFGSQEALEWSGDLAPLVGLPLAILAAVVALVGRNAPLRTTLVTVASALTVAAGHVTVAPHLGRNFDLAPLASYLGRLQSQGHPIANVSKYHGQYHFLGRLERPIEVTWENEVAAWARAHPDGKIVAYHDHPIVGGPPELVHPYRGHQVAVWDAVAVAADPDLVHR